VRNITSVRYETFHNLFYFAKSEESLGKDRCENTIQRKLRGIRVTTVSIPHDNVLQELFCKTGQTHKKS
jgi:hypothetical protein